MQQFYLSSLNKDDSKIHFDKNESKHLSKVLRKKVGDSIAITNGVGHRFSATLSHVDHKACTAIVNQCVEISPDPYQLHVFIAPTKTMTAWTGLLKKPLKLVFML